MENTAKEAKLLELIVGKPTLSASLPCQQIKQAKQYQPKPLESFNYALLQCGEATK